LITSERGYPDYLKQKNLQFTMVAFSEIQKQTQIPVFGIRKSWKQYFQQSINQANIGST
jgi:hypothetical protein